jgi:hypothetical protein
MRRTILPLILALGASAFPVSASAFGLTTGADFLGAAPAARPDAMGQAFGAMADDVNTVVYNPAGLGVLRHPEAGYSRYEFVPGVRFDFLAVAIPLGKPGALGMAYQSVGTGPFDSTGDPAVPPASASEEMVLLGWGRSFGRLQAGASVRKVRRDLDGWGKDGVAADLGARLVPASRLSLAAVMTNAGPLFASTGDGAYPLAWRLGARCGVVEAARHRLDAVTDILFGQENREVRWGAGAEYWYRETGALRAGWAVDGYDSQQEGASFGAGLRVRGFGLDYSIRPFATMGAAHRFSGSWRWEGVWLPDVEPSTPVLFRVVESGEDAWARWREQRGERHEIEIVRTELDTGVTEVLGPFRRPPVLLAGSRPGKLYRVFARSVAGGGRRSLPSQMAFYSVSVWPPVEQVGIPPAILPTPTATPVRAVPSPMTPSPIPRSAQPKPVEGSLETTGLLRLDWGPAPGGRLEGYQVYWRDRQGNTLKLNRTPIGTRRAWIAGEQARPGCVLLVTGLRPDGTEAIVGVHVCTAPDEWQAARGAPPRIVLRTSGNGVERRLEWEPSPGVERYLVLFAETDGAPYVALGGTDGIGRDELPGLLKGIGEGRLILVGLDERGNWVSHSGVTRW